MYCLRGEQPNKEEVNEKGIRILKKDNPTLVMIRMMRNESWIPYKKMFSFEWGYFSPSEAPLEYEPIPDFRAFLVERFGEIAKIGSFPRKGIKSKEDNPFGKLINGRPVFYSDFWDCHDIIENDLKDTSPRRSTGCTGKLFAWLEPTFR